MALGDTTIDPQLLDTLLRARGGAAMARIAEKFSWTSTRLMDELDRLRAAGCEIEVNPAGHVRFERSGLGAWADYIRWSCAGRGTVEVYGRTTSTQDVARRLIADHGSNADGALIAADVQTAGRGRMGRHWLAPPGTAALFSRVWVAEPRDSLFTTDRLLFATAVAVSDALEAVGGANGPEVRIRWPNDILIEGLKVAGILVESISLPPTDRGGAVSAAVIGVGVNVGLTPREVSDHMPEIDQVTSLAMCGVHADRLLVLARIVQHMDHALTTESTATLLDRWRRRSTVLDRRVALIHDGRTLHGRVVDLDPRDGLILRTDDGVAVHLPAESSRII